MTKSAAPQIVGVIFSPADFRRATRMRNPPDLFELRLDALRPSAGEVQRAVGKLPAPVIITARHPREGGANDLSLRERRDLLLQFLPQAAYLDIELRSTQALAPLLKEARSKTIRIIISFHDFTRTPGRARLNEIAEAAHSLGADVVKIATRTDTGADLQRLLGLFDKSGAKTNLAVMGIGRFGGLARRESIRRGSVLNYVHLGRCGIAGQPSLSKMRRWASTRKKLSPPVKLAS